MYENRKQDATEVPKAPSQGPAAEQNIEIAREVQRLQQAGPRQLSDLQSVRIVAVGHPGVSINLARRLRGQVKGVL